MLRIEEYNLLINSAGEYSEVKKTKCTFQRGTTQIPTDIPEEIVRDFCTIHLFVPFGTRTKNIVLF